jgi:hypothetical protein
MPPAIVVADGAWVVSGAVWVPVMADDKDTVQTSKVVSPPPASGQYQANKSRLLSIPLTCLGRPTDTRHVTLALGHFVCCGRNFISTPALVAPGQSGHRFVCGGAQLLTISAALGKIDPLIRERSRAVETSNVFCLGGDDRYQCEEGKERMSNQDHGQ